MTAPKGPPRAAILSISTSRFAGTPVDDLSGAELVRFAEGLAAEVVSVELVPDSRNVIEERLRNLADVERCDLILTTGGTGFAPDDVTPEATSEVCERLAPGLAEAMRLASREYTPHWMLARNCAGIRGTTLIVNFPGSPKAIGEAGAAIADALPHALRLLGGESDGH